MENLIIILSVLLNIALIISVAVYMKRFNKVSEDFKNISFEGEKQIKSKEGKICELNKEIEDHIITMDERQKQIVELIQKCDRQNAEIESLQSINSTLLNDNRKLSDEITILKEQVESLTNHLQEQLEKHEGAKPKPKTKKGLKINYPDKNDFRNNV